MKIHYVTKRVLLAVATLAVPVLVAGCSGVTQDDLTDAREEVKEEEKETHEVRREAMRDIEEEEQETEKLREEFDKPYDEEAREQLREEVQETEAVREEAREEIRGEKDETDEAEKDLTVLEEKFRAQQERSEYVNSVEADLEAAETRIAELEENADELDGPALEETNKAIEVLQDRHDRLDDHLDEMTSADALDWEEYRDEVERARTMLKQEMNEAK